VQSAAGAGHGLAFLNAQEELNHIAPQERRGEVTAVFIACIYFLVASAVIGTGLLDLRFFDSEKGDPMSTKLHITEVGRVAIPAADQDRALEFYVDTLGFEKRVDETFADGKMRWIEVVPPNGTTAIALTPPMEGGPTSVDSGIIISTEDVEADHAALKGAGVDVDDEIMRMGPPVPPMFRLRDPNGNGLTIVEPLT